jgi:predicted Zn-dependent protease
MKSKFVIVILLTFTIGCYSTAQQDFNNFKSLRSQGDMPNDFSYLTSEKVKEQIGKGTGNLSKNQEKVFLEGIYYGIDQLLHSGMVIYGDEISIYVKSIGDKLLKAKYPELVDKLRFYTIKSNVSNALSTDQGIVFVTTGLVSQLTSEAQLAYVLAHEISHYTEHHVVETFEHNTQNRANGDNIRQLSVYAKDKEFEADKLGISLYNKAGYSKDELLPTFDVLMYSYLPFDEVEFPKTYFNTPLMYIPEEFFPSKKYEIKAIEDYDDSKSSHPNIRRRKEEVEKLVKEFLNWGSETAFFGNDKFKYIRNLCRFESIRTSILEAQYADALYSIFLLEREFPNSTFLKRMKAHTWLGLAQYKNAGSINETVNKTSDFEGEIAAVHFFIKQLKNEATSTVALREIQNIRISMPNDEEIDVIWNRMVKLVATSKHFDLTRYSDKTFEAASEAFLKPHAKDSSILISDGKLSKYDKIKNKKSNNDPTVFDSSKFYFYGINDLIKDEAFNSKYSHLRDSINQIEKDQDAYDNLSTSEKRKFDKTNKIEILKTSGIKDFILVEPTAISYKNGRVDYNSSDILEKKYTDAINSIGEDLDLSIYNINSEKLNKIGTIGFNERSVLTCFLTQISHNEKVDILPIDYQYLREIESNYGTSKVIFTIVEHRYKPHFSAGALWFLFYPPALLGYIPIPFMKGNETELNLIVIDTKNAKIENGFSYSFNEPLNKYILKARMYDIFQNLKMN